MPFQVLPRSIAVLTMCCATVMLAGCPTAPKMVEPLAGLPVKTQSAEDEQLLQELVGRPAGLILSQNTRNLFKSFRESQKFVKEGWAWSLNPDPQLQDWLAKVMDPAHVVRPIASSLKDQLGDVAVLSDYSEVKAKEIELVAIFDLQQHYKLLTMSPTRYRYDWTASLYYVDGESGQLLKRLSSAATGECEWRDFDADDNEARQRAFIAMWQCLHGLRDRAIAELATKIAQAGPRLL